MPIHDRIITVSDDALEAVLRIRAQEPDAADLALRLSIDGVRGVDFNYELTFIPVEDAGPTDALAHYGELPVVIPGESIENLRDAGLHVSGGGLAIENPNSPIPTIEAGTSAADGPVAERVATVLREHINPAIASHGGFAELVAVEDDIAYLRLGGGCQGCGLAQFTLGQGIEVAIKNAVPEIRRVVDVTDHASGTNPYYESAKK